MKLFRKKQEEKPCCCSDSCTPKAMQKADASKAEQGIKILGSGCKKCNDLEKSVMTAMQELGLDLKIEHIQDFTIIASYGVMTTPAFVFNGRVVSYGKVLRVEEVKEILKKEMDV